MYILTCVDAFTNWAEAFPLRNKEAETVAKVLVEQLFCRFGTPLSILSDQLNDRIMREVAGWSTSSNYERHCTNRQRIRLTVFIELLRRSRQDSGRPLTRLGGVYLVLWQPIERVVMRALVIRRIF